MAATYQASTTGPNPQTRVPFGTSYLRFVGATSGRVFQVKQAKVRRVVERAGLCVVELVDGLAYPTATPWKLWCAMDCFVNDAREARHPHFLGRTA